MRNKVAKLMRKLAVNKAHYKAMKREWDKLSITDKEKLYGKEKK